MHVSVVLCDLSTYLALDILSLILVVVGLHALLQFLDELLFRVLVYAKREVISIVYGVNFCRVISRDPTDSN